jgi:hypothetical protein
MISRLYWLSFFFLQCVCSSILYVLSTKVNTLEYVTVIYASGVLASGKNYTAVKPLTGAKVQLISEFLRNLAIAPRDEYSS